MSQLSLFSADLTPPQLLDLGGLLAAPGQVVTDGRGTSLSILVTDRWRGEALLRECRVRDVPATLSEPPALRAESGRGAERDAAHRGDTADDSAGADDGQRSASAPPMVAPANPVGLRTERTTELDVLAREWTRGAVKSVPSALSLTPGFMRCWVIAAGRPTEVGVLLALDPRAPDTHEALAAACAAVGLAGSLLGIRGGGPAVRIVGYRRCSRLAEMIGSPPPEAPPGAFPVGRH